MSHNMEDWYTEPPAAITPTGEPPAAITPTGEPPVSPKKSNDTAASPTYWSVPTWMRHSEHTQRQTSSANVVKFVPADAAREELVTKSLAEAADQLNPHNVLARTLQHIASRSAGDRAALTDMSEIFVSAMSALRDAHAKEIAALRVAHTAELFAARTAANK